MKIEDFPYLREISIDYKHHIGGYMGGGSWAITTKRDSNGDRARIILGRGLLDINHMQIMSHLILLNQILKH